jgi:hypothetical protein
MLTGRGGAVLSLAWCAMSGTMLASQAGPPLGAADRARIAEVGRLAMGLRPLIWPGWERTPLAILLVTDSAEYLFGHPTPSSGFTRTGHDSVLGDLWTRTRVFPPSLLATFPAVAGLPTIVVGTAEQTRKSSAEWVLTLLHEHFHQWQYSLPDYYRRVGLLDLSGGDSTGMWMLNYPFPYDSAPVQQAAKDLAQAVSRALDAAPSTRRSAVASVIRARAALMRRLTRADNRYLEFQLWQEGVARFIEYKAASLAASLGEPSRGFKALPDYQPYEVVAKRGRRELSRELAAFDLGKHRRTSFYPIGAAMALLLEEIRSDWKQEYEAAPFAMTSLFSAKP